jgi:hypothetical protein
MKYMTNYSLFGKPMFRRVIGEIEQLYAWYDDVRIVYDPNTKSHSIHVVDRRNKQKYDIYLSHHFPFHPPEKIYVNGSLNVYNKKIK